LLRTEISNKENKSDIEDKEYLEYELKTLISDSRRVMYILEQDIKIGTKPRYHEVYATLTKSVLDGIKELRELNQTIANLKFQKEKLAVRKEQYSLSGGNGNNSGAKLNVRLSGKDLFDMMEAARKSSGLNAVKAEFEVESETVIEEKKKLKKDEA
jgi:hypothetical protein